MWLRILRAWAAGHRYGNATTAQVIALAERHRGRHLAPFFHLRLHRPKKPTTW